MVEMPTHLRVGPVVYRVVEWEHREAYASAASGECDRPNRVIRVREDLNRDDKARVLLHEVMHAAYDMGALADGEREEQIVTVLANQMTAIWRDNPDFVRFMNDALSVDAG